MCQSSQNCVITGVVCVFKVVYEQRKLCVHVRDAMLLEKSKQSKANFAFGPFFVGKKQSKAKSIFKIQFWKQSKARQSKVKQSKVKNFQYIWKNFLSFKYRFFLKAATIRKVKLRPEMSTRSSKIE